MSPGKRNLGPKGLITFGAVLLFAAPASAQRLHVAGLIGEPPDVSNWPHPAAPDGNKFPRSTATPAELKYRDLKAQLGKALFWEEQVSVDNTMSCGTCHLPKAGGTDNRLGAFHPNGNQGAFGVIGQAVVFGQIDYGYTAPASANFDRLPTGIHTPTMIGSYVFERQFWDMRAGPDFSDEAGVPILNFGDWASAEDQAVGPVISDVEMGHQNMLWSQNLIQKKIGTSFPLALVDPGTIPPDVMWLVTSGADYNELFDKIYFTDPQFGGHQGVTRERFAMAIAHYERTLIPDQAPIDTATMSLSAVAGFNLVKASGCFACHSTSGNPTLSSPTGKLVDAFDNPFSDGRFHNIGFGVVKTPTLRNVALRAKFFSTGNGNGGLNTLNDIITFYDNQPGFLGLNGSGPGGTLTVPERKNVTNFFHSLTDKRVANALPPFDRPELASERSDFNPFEGNEYGVGTAGPSGLTPEILANAPPLVTTPGSFPNPWFKVGVGNAPPLSSAMVMVSGSSAPGPTIWVGPAVFTPPVTINAQGIGTVHSPLPLVPSSIGLKFFTQWIVSDGGGFGFSDAAVFKPFMF